MRRRGDLTGWILMAVLFIGAMALIFYILLLRAQSLANMEDRRENPDGGAGVERVMAVSGPIIMQVLPHNPLLVAHVLVFEPSAV